MSITEISIRRPTLVVVLFTVLGVLGYLSYTKLSYELIPKFTSPVIAITTIYPGAAPAEVETSVTKPLEEAVSGLGGIEDIRSTSGEGSSQIIISFLQGVDINLALQDAQRKVNAVIPTLPNDAKAPVLANFSSDEFPIMNIAATSTLPPTVFSDLANNQIQPAIASVDGVGQVSVVGGEEREISVSLQRDRLEAYGLAPLQIVQAIRSANLEFPTGRLKNENREITIRLAGKFSSLEDLRRLVISERPDGSAIRLSDVAVIQDGRREITNISRLNGKNSLGFIIIKQSDANAVAVSEGVQQQMRKLEQQYQAEGLKFEIANNTTDFTISAVDAVTHDLSLAVFLVALVMLIFLHSLRNALIVLVAIPTSLVSTFIGMYLFDFTLNLMTLLAMSLVIGILVDDSIVVLENIYRHLEKGEKPRVAALNGRNEIGFTAVSITLVDVVVFLPIALAGGIIGMIMRQFALVVVFSTLMSLLVSFTVTPLLASRFSRLEHPGRRSIGGWFAGQFEGFLAWLQRGYGRLLKWTLKYPLAIIAAAFVLFFSSFTLVSKGYIGTDFITQSDNGQFIIQLELPKDATVRETNLASLKAEQLVRQVPVVEGVFTTVGATSEFLTGGAQTNIAELNVKLVDQQQRELSSEEYAYRVRNELEMALPGVKVRYTPVSFFGGADQAPIQLIINGDRLDQVRDFAEKVLEEVKQVPGTLEAKLTVEDASPELGVHINREQMAAFGLTIQQVGGTLQTAFAGNTDARYTDGDNEYDIRVQLDAFDRRRQKDLESLTFLNNRGQLIRLTQFATIQPGTGPNQLDRFQRRPSITVQAQVLGRPAGTVGAEIQAKLQQQALPPGISISYDGVLKQQAESFGSLGLAFGASILFVYLIMVALYNSYFAPFVVMFSIPMAMIGALLALALSMGTLDIFSILGIIMLVGLVGKNAILLVDFTNHLKEQGHRTARALLEAGHVRLRPILMTTIAMVFGMLPIAIAKGAGAEWKNGLAWALIGGLTSSMFLTLLLVPAIFLVLENTGKGLGRLWRRISGRRPAAVHSS